MVVPAYENLALSTDDTTDTNMAALSIDETTDIKHGSIVGASTGLDLQTEFG